MWPQQYMAGEHPVGYGATSVPSPRQIRLQGLVCASHKATSPDVPKTPRPPFAGPPPPGAYPHLLAALNSAELAQVYVEERLTSKRVGAIIKESAGYPPACWGEESGPVRNWVGGPRCPTACCGVGHLHSPSISCGYSSFSRNQTCREAAPTIPLLLPSEVRAATPVKIPPAM